MTEEQNKLAEEIECNGINGRDDFSIADKEAIIAALRREPDPVLGECEECGHTIVTPLKRFREREPATEAVLKVPLDLKMLALRAEQGELLNEFAGAEGYVEYDLRTKENGYVATVRDYNTAVFITYLWNWFRTLKGKGASQGAAWFKPNDQGIAAPLAVTRDESAGSLETVPSTPAMPAVAAPEPSGELRLTDEEIIAAWNGAVPDSKDKGIEMYLHLMRAVADAQYRKAAFPDEQKG